MEKLQIIALLTALLFCSGSSAQDTVSCFQLLASCEMLIRDLQEVPATICSPQSNITMCRVGIRDTCDPIFIPTVLSEAAKFYDYRCSEAGQQEFQKFTECSSISTCQARRLPPTDPIYCTASGSYVSCVAAFCDSEAESYARAEEELVYVLSYRLCGITSVSCRDKHSLCESSQTTGDLAGLCSIGRSCLEDAYQTCQDETYGRLIAERIGVIAYKCSEQGMRDKISFASCQSFMSCRSEARAKGLEICQEGDEIIACLQRNCSEGAARYYRETSAFTGCRGISTATAPTLVPSTGISTATAPTLAPSTEVSLTRTPPIELNACQQTAVQCAIAIDNWLEDPNSDPFCSDVGIQRCRRAIRQNCEAGTVPPVWYEVAKFYDYRCSPMGQLALRQLRACSRGSGCDEISIADCQSRRLYLNCVTTNCNSRASRYARAEQEIVGILSLSICGSDAMSCIDKYIMCQSIFISSLSSANTYEAVLTEICSMQSAYRRCLNDVRETCSNNAVAKRIISEPIRVLDYKCSPQGKQDKASSDMCAIPIQGSDTTLHHCQRHEQDRAFIESTCGIAAARFFNKTTEEATGICIAKEPQNTRGTIRRSGSINFVTGNPTSIMVLVLLSLLFK